MSSTSAIFHLFDGLPRFAPGSDASTKRALRLVPGLPENPLVLDFGCGAGRQTLLLARELNSRVTAVDIHQPCLDALRGTAAKVGLAERIETRCSSMDEVANLPGPADLIWSEGAIYNIGVETALRLWHPLLRRAGTIAFTECSWLTDDRTPEAVEFWRDAYPAMADVASHRITARLAGYDVIATFTLPASDWWDEFYIPLEERIADLEAAARDWPDLAAAIDDAKSEISIYRRFGDSYGYVFYVVNRPAE